VEKYQASAAAQALLEPDLRGQDERRAEKRGQQAVVARQRQLACFSLAGIACGIAIAYYLEVRVARGIIWGGIAGATVGLFVRWLQDRAAAT
jgi:hypothetical protein